MMVSTPLRGNDELLIHGPAGLTIGLNYRSNTGRSLQAAPSMGLRHGCVTVYAWISLPIDRLIHRFWTVGRVRFSAAVWRYGWGMDTASNPVPVRSLVLPGKNRLKQGLQTVTISRAWEPALNKLLNTIKNFILLINNDKLCVSP